MMFAKSIFVCHLRETKHLIVKQGKLARASEKTKRLISQRGREVQLRRTRKVKLRTTYAQKDEEVNGFLYPQFNKNKTTQ